MKLVSATGSPAHEQLLRRALTLPCVKIASIRTYIASLPKPSIQSLGAFVRTLDIIVGSPTHMEHLTVKEWRSLFNFAELAIEYVNDLKRDQDSSFLEFPGLEILHLELIKIICEMLQFPEAVDRTISYQLHKTFENACRQNALKQSHAPWLMSAICQFYQLTQKPGYRQLGMQFVENIGKQRSQKLRTAIFRFLVLIGPTFKCGFPLLQSQLENAAEFVIPPSAVEMEIGYDSQLPFRPASLASVDAFIVAMGLGVSLEAYLSDSVAPPAPHIKEVLTIAEMCARSNPEIARRQKLQKMSSNASVETSPDSSSVSTLSLTTTTPDSSPENSDAPTRKRYRDCGKLGELLRRLPSMASQICQALAFSRHCLDEVDAEYIVSNHSDLFWSFMALSRCDFVNFSPEVRCRIWQSCADNINNTGVTSGACYCLSMLVPIVAAEKNKTALSQCISLLTRFTESASFSSGALSLCRALHGTVLLDTAFEELKTTRLPEWLVRATVELVQTTRAMPLPPLLTQFFTLFTGLKYKAVYHPQDETRFVDLIRARDYIHASVFEETDVPAPTRHVESMNVPDQMKDVLTVETDSVQTTMIKCAIMGLLKMDAPVKEFSNEDAMSATDLISVVWFVHVAAVSNFGPETLSRAATAIKDIRPADSLDSMLNLQFADVQSVLGPNANAQSKLTFGFSQSTLEVLDAVVKISQGYTTQRSPRLLQRCIDAVIAIFEGPRPAENLIESYKKLVNYLVQIVVNQSPYSRLRTAGIAQLRHNVDELITTSDNAGMLRLVETADISTERLQHLLRNRRSPIQLFAIKKISKRASDSVQLLVWILQQKDERIVKIVEMVAKRYDTTPQRLLVWVAPRLFQLFKRVIGPLKDFPFEAFAWTGPKHRFLLRLSGDDLPPPTWQSDECIEMSVPVAAHAHYGRQRYLISHDVLPSQVLLQLARNGFIHSVACEHPEQAIEQLLMEAAVPPATAEDRRNAWKIMHMVMKNVPMTVEKVQECVETIIRGGLQLLRGKAGVDLKEIQTYVTEMALRYKTQLRPDTIILAAWRLPLNVGKELVSAKRSDHACEELHKLFTAPSAAEKLDLLNTAFRVLRAPYEYFALVLTHTAKAVEMEQCVQYFVNDTDYESLKLMVKWVRRLREDPECSVLNGYYFISYATQMVTQVGNETSNRPGYVLSPYEEERLKGRDVLRVDREAECPRQALTRELAFLADLVPFSERQLLAQYSWNETGWILDYSETDGHSIAARICDTALRELELPPLGYLIDRVPVARPIASAATGLLKTLSQSLVELLTLALRGADVDDCTLAVDTLSLWWQEHSWTWHRLPVDPATVAEACMRTNRPLFGIQCAELAWAITGKLDASLAKKLYGQLLDDEELRSDLLEGIPRQSSLTSIIERATGYERLGYTLSRYEQGLANPADMGGSLAAMGIFKLAGAMSEQLDNYEVPWRLQQWSLPTPQEPQTLPEVLFSAFRTNGGEPCKLETAGFTWLYECLGKQLFASTQKGIDFRPAYAMQIVQDTFFKESYALKGESFEGGGLRSKIVLPDSIEGDLRQARELAVRTLNGSVVRELLQTCTELRESNHQREALGYAMRLSTIASTELEKLCATVNEAETAWFLGERKEALSMLQGVTQSSAFIKFAQPSAEGGDKMLNCSRTMCLLGEWSVVAKTENNNDIETILTTARKFAQSSADRARALHILAKFSDSVACDDARANDINELRGLLHKLDAEQKKLANDNSRRREFEKTALTRELWERDLSLLEAERKRFLSRAIEGYLMSMALDPVEYSHDMSRLIALWFLNAKDGMVCKIVSRRGIEVSSTAFLPWLNQLTSGLTMDAGPTLPVLKSLLLKIARKHYIHVFWPLQNILFGADATDTPTTASHEACMEVMNTLMQNPAVNKLKSLAFEMRSLALEKAEKNMKLSRWWTATLPDLGLPAPTETIPVSLDGDYSNLPYIIYVDKKVDVATGLSAPKVVKMADSKGRIFQMLLKSGSDDLRQDAVMEQAFREANKLLPYRHNMRTYNVIPLGHNAGAIEFVQDTKSLMDALEPIHSLRDPHLKTYSGKKSRAMLVASRETGRKSQVLATYKRIAEHIPPVMRWFFFEEYRDPERWLNARSNWSRSVGVASIVGWVLGLGDRHCNNLLVDLNTGEVVHIDLGIAFEHGRRLRIPETVPFRLTRDIVDGMGATGTDGGFTPAARRTLASLRDKHERILTVLEVFRYDALYKWRVTKRRARQDDATTTAAAGNSPSKELGNESESSEADGALRVVRKKLTSGLSVDATVSSLIQEATDPNNLALLFAGWYPFY